MLDATPVAEITQRFDEDQTSRYAPASGDDFPAHLDDEFARAAGLPGIIVHGLCTIAFVSHAAIGAVAGGELRRGRRDGTRAAARRAWQTASHDLPVWIVTRKTVPSATETFPFVADYQEQYRKLWGKS